MSNNREICFASHNDHKLAEIRQILPEYRVKGLLELGLTEEIPETGKTLPENSALKATFLFDKYGLPCLADDSGLEVAALNNEPGVYSARYAGEEKNPEANMALLLANMTGKESRKARFRCVISYVDENGRMFQFEGEVNGVILHKKKGSGGFGYDPIFQPDGFQQSFAEMPADLKNSLSHRGKAMLKLKDFLGRSE